MAALDAPDPLQVVDLGASKEVRLDEKLEPTHSRDSPSEGAGEVDDFGLSSTQRTLQHLTEDA